MYSLSLLHSRPSSGGLYTLSLHDALPISDLSQLREALVERVGRFRARGVIVDVTARARKRPTRSTDRKSTRLNSSHRTISYAVFCLKKKKNIQHTAKDQRHVIDSTFMLQA